VGRARPINSKQLVVPCEVKFENVIESAKQRNKIETYQLSIGAGKLRSGLLVSMNEYNLEKVSFAIRIKHKVEER
jgi:hypothetical protein